MAKGIKDLLAEAEAVVTSTNAAEAARLLNDEDAAFVDLRDVREVAREGRIPGSVHVPRGMLEFWLDPESPYHREIFSSGKRFVFYCNKGWRSALAAKTAQEMGLERVSHLSGGFETWRAEGGATEINH